MICARFTTSDPSPTTPFPFASVARQVLRPREPAPARAAACVHHGMDGWPGADTGRRRRQGTGV